MVEHHPESKPYNRALVYLLCLMMGWGVFNCAYQVRIQPDLRDLPKSIPLKNRSIAVVMPSRLRAYQERGELNAGSGSGRDFVFTIGQPLSHALLSAVENIYRNVEPLIAFPEKDSYDYVIVFEYDRSKLDLFFQDGFVGTTAKAHYVLSVDMSVYNGKTFQDLRHDTIEAKAISSSKTGNENAKEVFSRALESAIEQLAFKVNAYLDGNANRSFDSHATTDYSASILLDIKKVINSYLLVYYPSDIRLSNSKSYPIVRLFHFNGNKEWRAIGFAELVKARNGKAAMQSTIEQHYAPVTITDKIEYSD